MSDKPQKQATAKAAGNFQHQYLPELLVNVYVYRLMVKVCLAVVCVGAGFSQIRLHTRIHTYVLAVPTT